MIDRLAGYLEYFLEEADGKDQKDEQARMIGDKLYENRQDLGKNLEGSLSPFLNRAEAS